MDRKYFFFDIDGTLLVGEPGRQYVPDSAKETLKKDECREKGFAWGFSPDDAIKEKASYVTTDAADDGIYNACSHFGWI